MIRARLMGFVPLIVSFSLLVAVMPAVAQQADTTSADTTTDTTTIPDTVAGEEGAGAQETSDLPSLTEVRGGPPQEADDPEDAGDGPSALPSLDEVRGGAAQEGEGGGEDRADLPSLQSVVDSAAAPPAYIREVFTYPREGRIDPVTLPASVASEDAFPELSLTGIVFDEDQPSESAAILRVTSGSDTPDRHVVRAGDMIDQYEIAAVERDRVAIDIHLLGTLRRMYLQRNQDSDGGSRR